MVETWSHPKLTGGRVVELPKLNVEGHLALARAQLALAEKGEASHLDVSTFSLFVPMAYHTLKRAGCPATLADVQDLELADVLDLWPKLLRANKREGSESPNP